MNEIEKFSLAAVCLNFLAEHDLQVEETSDPDRARELSRMPGKPYRTPLLDPDNNDFTAENFFWLAIKSHGQVKMVGGARVDFVPKGGLSSFWGRANTRGYGRADTTRVTLASELANQEIHGRVAYFGDLFADKSFRGQPNQVRCFLALAHLKAWVKWDPECICGFVRELAIERGIDRSYGFLHGIPRAQEWWQPPSSRGSDEWLVYNRSPDYSEAMNYAVDALILGD